MAAEFSIQAQPDHIRVEISGQRVPGRYVQDMLAGWSRVAVECHARRTGNILCINRLSGPSARDEAYEISTSLQSIFHGTPLRLAQVVHGDSESKVANRFAEKVTVNRGIEARNFADEGAALAWLLPGR